MIFVFGSNLAGRHGKGAALFAKKHRGAIYGQGAGRQGNSYAIPTKTENLGHMSVNQIYPYIQEFCAYAEQNKNERFELTPIGTGLAGHSKKDILAMFKECGVPRNVFLSSTWVTD